MTIRRHARTAVVLAALARQIDECDHVIHQHRAAGYRPGDQATATRRACHAVVVVWAVIAATGSAYLFLCSTQALTEPGGVPPLWGPAWVQSVGYLAAWIGTIWGAVLLVLLVLGVFYLRREIRAKLGWVLAWIAAVAAAMTLEVLYFFGPPMTASYPDYVGDVTVRPEYLWLAAGFLAIGAVMLGILTAAGRVGRVQPDPMAGAP